VQVESEGRPKVYRSILIEEGEKIGGGGGLLGAQNRQPVIGVGLADRPLTPLIT
jgi:hypothetical protein